MSSLGALIGRDKYLPPDTTDLTSLLGHISRETHKNLRKALPARVEAVVNGNRVDVQVGLQSRYNDGTVHSLPIIPSVPVCMPQGQGYAIRLPVAVGDNGLVILADRCIETWLLGDGRPADPGDPRLHDLTDAIFIPGILTDNAAAAAGDTGGDLVVQNGAATLHVQSAGTYRIANAAAELVDLTQQVSAQLSSLASFLSTATCTPGGPLVGFDPASGKTPPQPLGALANAISAINILSAKIGTLKGK